ncbi:MAG: O-antigen ligase family protein [Acidimicrobiales bacterium]
MPALTATRPGGAARPAPPDVSPRFEPLPWPMLAVGAAALLVVGVAAGLAVSRAANLEGAAPALLGVALASVLAVLAATRFWAVVVLLFAVRSSLDHLKLGGVLNDTLSPSVVVGIMFLLSGAAWLAAQWWSKELRPFSASSRWFLAFAGACLLSALGSAGPVTSAQSALKVASGALMLAVLEQAYRQRPERLKTLLAAVAASLVVPAWVGLAQATSGAGADQYLEVSRIRGTFVHPNPFATWLVLVAVSALALWPHLAGAARAAAGLAAAVTLPLVVLTYARGAWIAFGLGVVVIGACQSRRLIVGLIVASLALVTLVPSISARLSDLDNERQAGRGDPNSLSWRISYWGKLLPLAAHAPVTGIGLDQVVATSEEKLQPHNSFVQALVETGVVGLGCLLGLVASLAVELRRAIRNAALGLERGAAVAAAAAAIGVASQLVSENLLTQAMLHWYLAAIVGFALAVPLARSAATAPAQP